VGYLYKHSSKLLISLFGLRQLKYLLTFPLQFPFFSFFSTSVSEEDQQVLVVDEFIAVCEPILK